MDRRDTVAAAHDAADSSLQVIKGVLVLSENDHLALLAVSITHLGVVLEDR